MVSALSRDGKLHPKELGNLGEKVIEEQNRIALIRGIAKLDKIPTPMRVCGLVGNGVYKATFAAKSTVDYGGFLLDGSGRAVFVECKAVMYEDLLEHGFNARRNVASHQLGYLLGAYHSRAVAGLVIVAIKSLVEYSLYALSPLALSTAMQTGGAVSSNHIEMFKVSSHKHYIEQLNSFVKRDCHATSCL